MTFKDDIVQKVKFDFGMESNFAFRILEDAIDKTEYLKTDRVIRCIIFLSNGNLEYLKKNIEVAIYDPRDVMFWAEYEKLKADTPKRIRDFNKTFEDCTNDVKE